MERYYIVEVVTGTAQSKSWKVIPKAGSKPTWSALLKAIGINPRALVSGHTKIDILEQAFDAHGRPLFGLAWNMPKDVVQL